MLQIIDGGMSRDYVAAQVENTRAHYLVYCYNQMNKWKRKFAEASEIQRNTMQRDGVLRSVSPAGTFILKSSVYWDTPSARLRERRRFGCNLQGRRDPYLVVIPADGGDDAA